MKKKFLKYGIAFLLVLSVISAPLNFIFAEDGDLISMNESVLTGERTVCFMNCDTGRILTVDGVSYFTLIKTDDNKYTLFDKGSSNYVEFSKNGVSFDDSPFEIEIDLSNDYKRYRIVIGDKVVLDDDKGNDNTASVALVPSDNMTLQTGWYITEQGLPLPLKLTVYGDSISNGVNPDQKAGVPHTGCRGELSKLMLEKYGRVVFVGSSRVADGNAGEKDSMINEDVMYRHEGHNGWVITSQEGYAPANNNGIDTLRENLQKKYNPDIICMMIGINDINQLNLTFIAKDTNNVRTNCVNRWLVLVNDILNDLPKDGHLVIGTCTPLAMNDGMNDGANKGIVAFNDCLEEEVDNFNNSNEFRISLAENYYYVYKLGRAGISSDTGHLSAEGYHEMTMSYFDTIVSEVGDREDNEFIPAPPAVKTDDEQTTYVTPADGKKKNNDTAIAVAVIAAAAVAVCTSAVIIIRKMRKK